MDVVDFYHNIVPTLKGMVKIVSDQKKDIELTLSTSEPRTRNDIMKSIENSMTSSSSRLTPDKLKEYVASLMDSMHPKITEGPGLSKWIEKYQKIIDEFDEDLKNALATVNVTTKVEITWDNSKPDAAVGSWNNTDYYDTTTVRPSTIVSPFGKTIDEMKMLAGWD